MPGYSPDRLAAAEERLPLVTVVEPIQKPAVRYVTLPASVEAYEKATLYAKVAGYLKWIKVDKGDLVRKGDILAFIEIPEMTKDYQRAQAAVQEAQASYERAQANAVLKELTFKRLDGIRKSQPEVISQQEVDVAKAEHEVARGEVQLAKARIALARSEVERVEVLMGYANIRAPYDGVVTDRFVDPGAMMQSATSSTGNVAPLVAVAHIDKVRVYVYVAEPDVSYVRPGDPVRVELDALPGKEFRGTVTRFATVLDPQTRTMKTEIDLANARHLIRPGMYGKAIIELSRESRALFLPTQSVHQDGEGNKYVYIVAQGRIQKAPVETGLDDGKLIQVKGLRGDEIVVLTATQSLQEGLAVKTVKASS
jgi:RND family efflux transporter MFP subunit